MEAEEYERMAAVEATHWWYAATRALLHQLVGPTLLPGGRFLDAGGGTGATGAWMGEQGTLVASDALPAALSLYARAHPCSPARPPPTSRRCPSPTAPSTPCCASPCSAIAPIADPAVAVAELARVTRPGGLVVLMEPGVRRLRRAHDRVTHSARRFSVGDLRAAAVAAGLEVVRAPRAPTASSSRRPRRRRSSSGAAPPATSIATAAASVVCSAGPLRVERRVLRRVSLPAGLSVVVVARRPS